MKALDYLKTYLDDGLVDQAHVLALSRTDEGKTFWWHVHKDEEVPEDEKIAISMNPIEWGSESREVET